MHQLSLSGSMLHVVNHDEFWAARMQELLSTPGASWEEMSGILRGMPGAAARRVLWRASRGWLADQIAAYPRQCEIAFLGGQGITDSLQSRRRDIVRVGAQLQALYWCEKATKPEPIGVCDVDGMTR